MGSMLTRRAALRWIAGGTALAASVGTRAQTAGHTALGLVEPRPAAPSLALTLHDGRTTRLETLLRGRVTALQLMFTGCSGTCPVQGAIFAAVQQRLDAANRSEAQLLSISIDPLGDDARALATWRGRLGAGPRWLAAVPPPAQADRLPDFLSGRPAQARAADRHTPQVYLFDTQGRLAYRFADLAAAADIARGISDLQRRG